MSQDPRIEAAARQVAVENGYPDFLYPDGMAEVTAKAYRDQAARILAAADKAATITTVDDLHALPVGVVLVDKTAATMELAKDDRNPDYGRWMIAGVEGYYPYSSVDLPARVIHWGQA